MKHERFFFLIIILIMVPLIFFSCYPPGLTPPTMQNPPVTQEEIMTISQYSRLMAVGDTTQLTVKITKGNELLDNSAVTWASKDNNIASVNNGLVQAKSSGETRITVKSNVDATVSASFTAMVANLKIVESANETGAIDIVKGEQLQLTAVLEPGHTHIDNSNVEWSVSSGNASITNKSGSTDGGIVTTTEAVSGTIRVSAEAAVSGISFTASADIAIVPASVKVINILSGNEKMVNRGSTFPVEVNVLDVDNNPISPKITWSSTDDTIATVSNGTSYGKADVTAHDLGDADIIAAVGNIQKPIRVHVRELKIIPPNNDTTLTVGETLRLSAILSPETGTLTTAEWSLADADKSIAGITASSGLLTTTTTIEDDVTVTAEITVDGETFSDTQPITVIPSPLPPVIKVSIKGESGIEDESEKLLADGGSYQLDAIVHIDGDIAQPADENIAWSSSDDTIASVDNSGKITAHKLGDALITAKSRADSTASAAFMAYVRGLAINIPASGSSGNTITSGEAIPLSAVFTPGNEYIPHTEIEWNIVEGTASISNEPDDPAGGILTTSSSISGTIRVSAKLKKNTDIFNEVTFTIIPVPAKVINLDGGINSKRMTVGETHTLTVSVLNLKDEEIVNPVITWSSSNESAVTVSTSGKITAVGLGTSTISAQVESVITNFVVHVETLRIIPVENHVLLTLLGLGDLALDADITDGTNSSPALGVEWTIRDKAGLDLLSGLTITNGVLEADGLAFLGTIIVTASIPGTNLKAETEVSVLSVL